MNVKRNENNVSADLQQSSVLGKRWKPIARLRRNTPEQLHGKWILLRQLDPVESFVAVKFDMVVHNFFDHQMTPIDPKFAYSFVILG